MMKKTLFLFGAMVVCATIIIGCEGTDDPFPIENSENNSSEVTGQMYDTGQFRALVPDGWKAFPIPDVFADEPDTMKTSCFYIIKDGTSAQDVHSKPYVQLEYYGPDIPMTEPDREQLRNVEDVAPMQLGDYTWIGFIGEDYFGSYGKGSIGRIACLWTEEGNTQYLAVIRLEFDGKKQKVTLEDKDLQAILSSVES